MAQHKATARPDEVACQGRRRHTATACHYVGLHPNGCHKPQHDAAQVSDERKIVKLCCEGARA
jgi:hypothetical protein